MIIHINSNTIKSNAKNGKDEPPISVRKTRSGKVIARCHSLTIDGASRIVYNADRPLPCGARVWLETDANLHLNLKKGD